MKRVVILIQIIIFFSVVTIGQIEYEGTINTMVKTIQLNDGVLHYIKLDSKKKAVNIYNPDSSLWKSIQLFVPKNESLEEVQLILQDVFNDNDLIEIVPQL